MASTRPLRWLHLSDLHLGCRGMEVFHQMGTELAPSVRALAAELGPPDLILLSGDLTFRGTAGQFDLVDRFLDRLLAWIDEAAGGAEPLLLAIPGNHDLVRPKGAAARSYRVLKDYDAGDDDPDVRHLNRQLWEQRKPALISRLFKDYTEWFERRIAPDLGRRARLTRSHFPGDFCAELSLPGTFPLVVVGLNSTWQQYSEGDFERRLSLPSRQFQAALPRADGGSPLAIFDSRPRALLMLHHPPSWLSEAGLRVFEADIYPPERFDLCLFGHLHKARSKSEAVSGAEPRVYFQSPSLFGLEEYGTKKEQRSMGYAWGSLSAAGEVRVWPLLRVLRGSGAWAFAHDREFPEDPAGTLLRGPRVVGGGRKALPKAKRAPRKLPAPSADFRLYLLDLVDQTDHLEITGIVQAGENREALRPPIEQIYTPLWSRDLERSEREGGLPFEGGRTGLAALLPRHPRLLVEGQPGAGKTTFLRLAACLLARDFLGVPCPAGPSWREQHLGLTSERPFLPLFIRAAELEARLAGVTPLRHAERLVFVDHLVALSEANGFGIDRAAWERLLAGELPDREALLLVDGLDEVAAAESRKRIFAAFRDAAKAWPCRIVVTSRPIDTAALIGMGFHLAVVEPFGEREIRAFLDRWVGALYPGERRVRAERYRQELAEALCKRVGIRRLATNPVMLTCLCVIHWNDQRLPDGRARVYRAVVKWLRLSRQEKRESWGRQNLPRERPESLGYFAERAFARLALAMMCAKGGKRAHFDLEEAAVAVEPVVERDFRSLVAEEDRRAFARDWLRFECLESGIVEEVSLGRLKFWHLTFQEYLAAWQLARQEGGDAVDSGWWPVVREHLDQAGWRETVDLLPGCLLDEGGEGRVDLLLERVLGSRGKNPDLAAEARVAGIVGRLLQTLGAYNYRPRPEVAAVYQGALDRSLALFTPEGAASVPLKDRVAAAEALGRGGDLRLAPEKDNFLEVPGLGGLQLGRYPVTVEEYLRFVEEGGYGERRFWDGESWAKKESEGWQAPDRWEEQLETPNRPVVLMSWYEATAYCRWLSAQRGREEVRLPTEAEWEKAATSEKGEYPWGSEEPDDQRANFGNRDGAPTPVGLFPAGDGRYGHSDLAGHVWEWCADRAEKLKGLGPEDEEWRALRGGGWFGVAGGLRSRIRFWRWPSDRSDGIGFRVAVVPASTVGPR